MKEITIKITKTRDGIYDVYVDESWECARGSWLNILDEVRRVLNNWWEDNNAGN